MAAGNALIWRVMPDLHWGELSIIAMFKWIATAPLGSGSSVITDPAVILSTLMRSSSTAKVTK